MDERSLSVRVRYSTMDRERVLWNGRNDRSNSIPMTWVPWLTPPVCMPRQVRKKKLWRYSSESSPEAGEKRDWVEHDPDYDILRDHPRFKELLARLK